MGEQIQFAVGRLFTAFHYALLVAAIPGTMIWFLSAVFALVFLFANPDWVSAGYALIVVAISVLFLAAWFQISSGSWGPEPRAVGLHAAAVTVTSFPFTAVLFRFVYATHDLERYVSALGVTVLPGALLGSLFVGQLTFAWCVALHAPECRPPQPGGPGT